MKLKSTFESFLWSDGDETPAKFEWKKLNKRERMENQKAIEDFEKESKPEEVEEKRKFLYDLILKRLIKVTGLFDENGAEVGADQLRTMEYDNTLYDAVFASYMQGLSDDAASLKPKKESPPQESSSA